MRAVRTGARAHRDMFVCEAPPPERRPEHRTDQADPGPPANGGKARRTCVPAAVLTRCMQVRFARARAKCAHRRAFKVHGHCLNAHRTTVTTMTTEQETISDLVASYAGTVTRCPPGKPRAPAAKEYGQAQLIRCRCGHAGTMPYPMLFKRLRRGRRRRKPLGLRCQRCGRVLRRGRSRGERVDL